jgi:soluble lytic murein transglycosylase-like protein
MKKTGQMVKCTIALLFCAICLTPTAHADIWGYIDDKGVGHFSATQVDARYELFSREVAHASDAAASQFGSDPLSFQANNCGFELVSDPKCLPLSLSPKLAKFFETSPAVKAVRPLLQEAAKRHGYDAELLQALIATESGFNASAVSPKGAMGLMQLMPATAKRYGATRPFDPAANIAAGAWYLKDLLAAYSGKLELALAAYNAGEGAVLKAGNTIPNYPETQNYVKTVMQMYEALKPPKPLIAAQASSNKTLPPAPDPLKPTRGRGNGLPNF